MKKTLKKVALSLISATLLYGQLPIGVLAQEDAESEVSSEVQAETTDEETAESDAETTEETEESSATDTENPEETTDASSETDDSTTTADGTHPLSPLIEQGNLMSDALAPAFEDFQLAVDQLVIADVATWEGEATSVEELDGLLQINAEMTHTELSEEEEYVSYRYYEEGMEGEEAGMLAELLLYFVEDKLIYIGVIPIRHEISQDNLLSEENIQSLYQDSGTLESFIEFNPLVSSFAQSYYNGEDVYMVVVPTGENTEEIQAEAFIFVGNEFAISYMRPYVEAIELLNHTMLQMFIQFYNASGMIFGNPVETEEAVPETESVEEASETVEETEESVEETSESVE